MLAGGTPVSFQSVGHFDAAREAAHAIARHFRDAGRPLPDTGKSAQPLHAIAHHVSDDLVVMVKEDGEWHVGAAVLTSPTFFSLGFASGRSLHELHEAVPGGASLAARIARVFDHIRPGQVLERFNWTLQAGDTRFTPDGAPLRERAEKASADEAEALLHVRVERQTIVRLPESGAVLFTIRVAIDPVSSLDAKEKAALGAAWHAAGDTARGYKKWAALDHLVAAALPRP